MRQLWDGFAYKPHQEMAIQWMHAREKEPIAGGIICDEMGLGKTIEALGLMKNQAPGQATLLIAPVAVLAQWAATAKRSHIEVWQPYKTAAVWIPNSQYVRKYAPQLYMISYDMARSRPSLVCDRVWDRVIFDEAHRLASANMNTQIAAEIRAGSRWFLTATPIVNGMNDLYTLFQLLGHEKSSVHAKEDRDNLIKTCILARTMEQLRASIPDAPPAPTYHKHSLAFDTEEEHDFYTGIQGVLVRRFQAMEDEGSGSALEKLKLLMRLRQLSLHPQVYIAARKRVLGAAYKRDDWTSSSTKFEKIKTLLDADPAPHKWIIFCHFHDEMALLKAELSKLPSVRSVGIYSGAQSAKEREAVLEVSRQPLEAGCDVLLIQLQAGGVGLNLQHCDRILFTGPWWTSALMEQAVGRAVQIGQSAVVQVHHILLKEEEGSMNIDRVIMEKAQAKGEMCRAVLAAANTTVQ